MTHSFSNPVVRGNAPDPSVIRVGEDFYLATSTFDFFPGILIHHSTDLVNWRLLGGAVDRPAQYRRDGVPGELMLFAPTLRYAEGRFHLACTNVVAGQGNFVLSAEDPAGPWSDAVWIDQEAFDPSLTYDAGRWLYTRRTLKPRADGRLGPVIQAEIDLATGELGPVRELTDDYQGFCSNDIEGPHLYRINQWYYLFSAEGSTLKGHMQTCGRSRSPWGPFEPAPHNPVLTHRHRVGHPIQSTGHAELVDDADGHWWALHLGTRHAKWADHHNLGRETFLAPVHWVEGWPIIGNDGTTELDWQLDRPLPRGPGTTLTVPETLWTRGWQSIGHADRAIDAEQIDRIVLPAGRGLDAAAAGRPVGALVRTQTEDAQSFDVTLARVDGVAQAGIAVYADRNHYYRLLVVAGGVVLDRVVDDLTSREFFPLDTPVPLALGIDATSADYRFRVAGHHLGGGSARLLSAETAEAFVGVRFALIAEGDEGSAVFTGATVSE